MRSVSPMGVAVSAALVMVSGSCTIVQPAPGAPAYVSSGTASLEVDVNRAGADYRSFDLASGTPEECRDTCLVEPQCQAFTFVKPGIQGPSARCWLKGSVPQPAQDVCCVSGIKASPPATPPGYAPPAGAPPAVSEGAPPPPQPDYAAPPPGADVPTPASRGGFVGEPPGARRGLEPGVNRPGADITSFDLPQPRPHLCQEACTRDVRCAAFTYVNPGVQGPNARCWLKNAVPNPVPDGCCTSGVKHEHHGEPMGGAGFEPNVNRPGYDFHNFDLPQPRPELCRDACLREGRCRAFTYVNPGVQGPGARCWLKTNVPPPAPSDCCISGVK